VIKQKRKKKRKLKKVLLGILILALVVLAGAFVVIKVFTVETVKVEGNKLYEDEVIKNSVLNDEYSWNTLYVFFKYKFKKTEEIPFVDSMEISMKIPHEITIQVYEKGMIGYVYIPSIAQNAYFDKDGFVVETSADNIEGVPLISGLSVDTVVL
jgi:cell division protein FtsQ